MRCYVIVTSRSLVWMVLTLISTLAVLSALLTSKWLVGPALSYRPRSSAAAAARPSSLRADEPLEKEQGERFYSKSLGLFTRCTLIAGREQCAPFAGLNDAEGGAGFPGPWQAAVVFLGLGVCLATMTAIASVLGCCVQAVCANKSLFSVAGAAQAGAGLLYIVGIVLFPFGFGSERVRRLCGDYASPFDMADCHFGWSLYVAIGGILGTFVCAVLSAQAEIATSSDRVQEEIDDGKTLICLP